MIEIDPSEITPEHLYLSRRKFIKGLGAAAAASALAAACAPRPTPTATPGQAPEPTPSSQEQPASPTLSAAQDELGNKLTDEDAINSYNNYYEFSLDKAGVAPRAKDFRTRPWTVAVGGLVNNPKTYDIDELLRFPQQERIYRLRCVEAWSMVIPWVGFPLSALLEEVEPTSEAKYIRFETIVDPEQMPNQRGSGGFYSWPYVEGLRLDEAMHDLTLLATGIYGKPLLPQTGAPIRLVVPWKYGFKYIKSIVKIDLVAEMPDTFWATASPREYGFYANVNPDVNHPRWSQATERRIGEAGRRPTLPFNGYEEQVAHLYEGMDLTQWF